VKPFATIQTQDFELQKVQDNVKAALSNVLNCLLLDGLLIEDVALTSGVDNPISHLLGRAPKLWMVAKKNANSTVWEVTSPATDRILNLRCSANCTISLWVA
jgi:hypothetical protein